MTPEEKLRKLFDAALQGEKGQAAAADAPAAAHAGTDEASSDELGRLLDERHARSVRRDRRNRWIGLAAVLALVAGGGAWLATHPGHLAQLKESAAEIRKAGDVKAIAAEYQASLDKIAARSGDLDEATKALGQTPEPRPEAPRAFVPQALPRLASSPAPAPAPAPRGQRRPGEALILGQ